MLRGDKTEGVSPPDLPKQVDIHGALIMGVLNLSDTKTGLTLVITSSKFDSRLNFVRAEFSALNFEYSVFADGCNFSHLICRGFLKFDNATSKGLINITRAMISGTLSFTNAKVSEHKSMALNAEDAVLNGGVYLISAEFMGCVSFISTLIEGQLVAIKTSFVNLDGHALNLQGVRIRDGIGLMNFPHPPVGSVNMVDSRLGHVVIDANSFPFSLVDLNGAIYTNIQDRSRPNWVAKTEGWFRPIIDHSVQDREQPTNFWTTYHPIKRFLTSKAENKPKPESEIQEAALREMRAILRSLAEHTHHPFAYRQFARVLDANGHEREARAVRIEAGHAYTERSAKTLKPWPGYLSKLTPIRANLYRFWRWIIRHLIGYGVKPWRVIPFMLGWLAIGSVIFALNYNNMTPARERFYLATADQTSPSQAEYPEISPRDPLPKGYPDYSPVMYALDVMLPIVDFAQESHWRPKNVGPMRFNWLRNFNRLFLAVGWAFSTIAVLGFTGLISDKKEP